MSERHGSAAHAVFDDADVRDVLREQFYDDAPRRRRRAPRKVVAKESLPYEVICISLYKEDLAALDAKVAALKAQGHRKMSRSALIRFALATVDATKLPRSY
jgi:hypothetical protein